MARISDRLFYANSQPVKEEEEKEIVTVQIFSECNIHTQQLPYSVCVRCHAAKLDKITQKVLKKQSSIRRNLRRKAL